MIIILILLLVFICFTLHYQMLTGTKVGIVLQKPQAYCQFLKKICYFCQLKENGPNQALNCKIIRKQYHL